MAEKHGPHDKDCATATPGTVCDCHCAGAQHAVARTPGGKPAASSVTRRAAAVAHAQGRKPVVARGYDTATKVKTGGRGLPDRPAKARSREGVVDRTRDLAPPKPTRAQQIAERIEAARAAMPRTRDGWNRLALGDPPTREQVDAALTSRDAAYAEYQRLSDVRDKALAAKVQEYAAKPGNYGKSYAAMTDRARKLKGLKALDDDADRQLEVYRAAHKRHDELQRAHTSQSGAPILDPATGLAMPGEKLNRHLDAVSAIGRDTIDTARQAWSADPEHRRLTGLLANYDDDRALRAAGADLDAGRPATFKGKPIATRSELFDLRMQLAKQRDDAGLAKPGMQASLRSQRAAIEQRVLLQQIDAIRAMGGPTHPDPQALQRDPHASQVADYRPGPARTDFRKRLAVAEQYFPEDWLDTHRDTPLQVVSSNRAYYRGQSNLLSMSAPDRDGDAYDGAFADKTDEVTVHELGHRMEQIIPGLTALEFALVRRRATRADGTVEPVVAFNTLPNLGYYDSREKGQPDEWANAYTGKTYEVGNPAGSSWEAFQTGLQDTFGRSSTGYGDTAGDLQAFVVGALLTLHGPASARRHG